MYPLFRLTILWLGRCWFLFFLRGFLQCLRMYYIRSFIFCPFFNWRLWSIFFNCRLFEWFRIFWFLNFRRHFYFLNWRRRLNLNFKLMLWKRYWFLTSNWLLFLILLFRNQFFTNLYSLIFWVWLWFTWRTPHKIDSSHPWISINNLIIEWCLIYFFSTSSFSLIV